MPAANVGAPAPVTTAVRQPFPTWPSIGTALLVVVANLLAIVFFLWLDKVPLHALHVRSTLKNPASIESSVFGVWTYGVTAVALLCSLPGLAGSMRPLLAIRLPSKHDLVVIGQTFAAILLIKFAYGWLLVALHHGRHTQNGWAHFRVYDTTEFLGVLFVSCLVAPVVEEFAFRGFLFNALVIRMPLVAAVLLDGVIFGLVHLDAVFFVPLALFGSLQALAYWRTKNLLVPITLHSLNNGLALAFALLAHHHRG